jgi:uncharacterized damage-inducible protein DinB
MDRGAFFRSIIGTLNHIVAGDITWLKRFAAHPSGHPALDMIRSWPTPAALDILLYEDLAMLRQQRQQLDATIEAWAADLTTSDLTHVLRYANTKGIVAERHFGNLVLHFFNHQTHHRGQVTTLLHQAGQDVGPTDLLMVIPNFVDSGAPR